MHKHDKARSEDEEDNKDNEENSVNKRMADYKECITVRQMT